MDRAAYVRDLCTQKGYTLAWPNGNGIWRITRHGRVLRRGTLVELEQWLVFG